MKRWIWTLGLAVLGCGSLKDSPACGTSADCAAGEYCAAAQGERRCWPDANDPVVSAVTVQCLDPVGGACPRDGTLRVTAAASDVEELAGVRVSLRVGAFDASPAVAMTRAGTTWTADVSLATAAMPAFAMERPVNNPKRAFV